MQVILKLPSMKSFEIFDVMWGTLRSMKSSATQVAKN